MWGEPSGRSRWMSVFYNETMLAGARMSLSAPVLVAMSNSIAYIVVFVCAVKRCQQVLTAKTCIFITRLI